MNHSMYGADRGTHLKIVAIAMCATVPVLSIGLSSRESAHTQTARLVKAAKPVMLTESANAVVR
jgi:hypothetical protein